MSDTTEIAFDVRAVLAGIDRDLAEQQKLLAEQRKLFADEIKLRSEELKLRSESRKLDRDRLLAPWLAILGLLGGAITVGGAIWRAVHP